MCLKYVKDTKDTINIDFGRFHKNGGTRAKLSKWPKSPGTGVTLATLSEKGINFIQSIFNEILPNFSSFSQEILIIDNIWLISRA